MKASVIMPVYNSEKYVVESIQSILNQSFRDFELIIVNDRSTDSSIELVSQINDPRIKILDLPENIGNALAMNKGIEIASGEYIFRMDSDDIALPTKMEKQIKYMDENPNCMLCGTWIKFFGEKENLFKYSSDPEQIKSDLFFFNCIAHPSVVIRKKFLDETGLVYTNDFPYAEDFDLWTKISKISLIHNIPEVLLMYRIHKEQIGSKLKDIQIKSVLNILIKQVSDFLGGINNEEEACRGIVNILISKKNTEEDKIFINNLFEKIIEHNKIKTTFNNDALFSTIEGLRKRGGM